VLATARHGSPQWRAGGVAHGPNPRDWSHDVPKQVRALGLCVALSDKLRCGQLSVVNSDVLEVARTQYLADLVGSRGWRRMLLVGGQSGDSTFVRAASNVRAVDVMPAMGCNVYDLLRHESVVLTASSVLALHARLLPWLPSVRAARRRARWW